jgi:hypothetical protein
MEDKAGLRGVSPEHLAGLAAEVEEALADDDSDGADDVLVCSQAGAREEEGDGIARPVVPELAIAALKLKEVKENRQLAQTAISEEAWTMMGRLQELLGIVNWSITSLEGDKFGSLSLVLSGRCALRQVIEDWRAPLLPADASGLAVTMAEEDGADDVDLRVKRALILAYDGAASIFDKQYIYKRKETKHLKGHVMIAALLNPANPPEVFQAGEYDEAVQCGRHYLKQYAGKQTPQVQQRTKRSIRWTSARRERERQCSSTTSTNT